MGILANVLDRLDRFLGLRSPATPSAEPPTNAELNRQWHRDRAKARTGNDPWRPGRQDQGQPGKSWTGSGGDGIGG
jgi:hypothetical protein